MRLHRNGSLFLVSFLILFLEVSLIRWVSTEVRIFAYVHNLVLLACFLGVGVGAYLADRRAYLGLMVMTLALLLLLVTVPMAVTLGGMRVHPLRDIPTMLSVLPDSLIWYGAESGDILLLSAAGITMTLLVFALILIMFVPLGQILGMAFAGHPDVLFAYSLNVLASLAGVWSFNLLSLGWSPPWIWFVVVLAASCGLIRWSWSNASLLGCCAAVLAIMAVPPLLEPRRVFWSPYQKLEAITMTHEEGHDEYMIKVNNKGYMLLIDLSARHLGSHPDIFDLRDRRFGQYDIPYLFQERRDAVLIVGSGGGNDVAGALRNGAGRVTAVEIDPGIVRLGRDLHPESPYADPRVEVVIDDARSYFRRTGRRFDLISFGLLDAHTLSSSYNNTRLDHYVYTKEAFAEAKGLLREGGVLTVIFESQRAWMGHRIAGLLKEVFGGEPLAFKVRSDRRYGYGGDMFVACNHAPSMRAALAGHPDLQSFVEKNAIAAEAPRRLTTDDWPYFYLEEPRVPMMHLALSGILIALFAGLRFLVIPAGRTIRLHFFLLGAAFLLLEFQNISKMQLLLGSTWVVNSFAISAILVMILVANVVARRWRSLNPKHAYGGLFLSLLIVYLVPMDAFLGLPYAVRGLLASLLLSLPVLFAGIVFIDSFRKAPDRNLALGSNILGAGVGGIMESLSFVTGTHSLLVLVGGLYLLSLAGLRR
jgi:hypothetical protein